MASNAIIRLNEYPEKDFNRLIPVQSITTESPLLKPVINVVHLSPDPRDGDCYELTWYDRKTKENKPFNPQRYALTKLALSKLMTAANIEIEDVKPIPVSTGEAKDIAFQVIIKVPLLTGGYRKVRGTEEVYYDDLSNALQKKKRAALCESKALNRALREALSIKQFYTTEDLKKPFAVALVTLNMEDPEVKRIALQALEGNVQALFGGMESNTKAIEAPGEDPGNVEIIDVENESNDDADIHIPDAPGVECHGCGAVLEGFEHSSKGWISAEQLEQASRSAFGKPLCRACYNQASKERAAKGGKK